MELLFLCGCTLWGEDVWVGVPGELHVELKLDSKSDMMVTSLVSHSNNIPMIYLEECHNVEMLSVSSLYGTIYYNGHRQQIFQPKCSDCFPTLTTRKFSFSAPGTWVWLNLST